MSKVTQSEAYTSVAYQIINQLHVHTDSRPLEIPQLSAITANLPSLLSDTLPFLPELISALFDLSNPQLQAQICWHLHSSLDSRSQSAFLALKLLLEKCLSKNTDIIQYLALFLLPVIKSIHHNVFEDEKMVMKILANLI